MEALLNTLWLLVALAGGVWAWALPSRDAVRANGYLRRGVLALCCCMVLILPLVSISDDLQYCDIAGEDGDCASQQGKVVKTAECKTTIHHRHHAPAVAPYLWWDDPEFRAAGIIRLDPVQPPQDVAAFAASERAPPSSCLS